MTKKVRILSPALRDERVPLRNLVVHVDKEIRIPVVVGRSVCEGDTRKSLVQVGTLVSAASASGQ